MVCNSAPFICTSVDITAFIWRSFGCDKAFMYIATTAPLCLRVAAAYFISTPRRIARLHTAREGEREGRNYDEDGYASAICAMRLSVYHHPKRLQVTVIWILRLHLSGHRMVSYFTSRGSFQFANFKFLFYAYLSSVVGGEMVEQNGARYS